MYRSTVLISLVIVVLSGATRPRYGGTLRVQLPDTVSLQPSLLLTVRDRQILACIGDPLVRVNREGDVDGALAESWQADSDFRQWRFKLRDGILLHDGSRLAGDNLVAPLAKQLPGADISATPEGVRILLPQSDPGILYVLAELPILIERANQAPIGAGPFLVESMAEPLRLRAFDGYWAGRAFLDAIEFSIVPTRADMWDVSPGVSRRNLPDQLQTRTSDRTEVMAVEVADGYRDLGIALSASVDRATMTPVLTQRRGEAAASLLPQRLSGYAFTFPITRDIARARQLRPSPDPIILAYDSKDSLARVIAERVAVNARDAGIVIQPKADGSSIARMRRFPLLADPATSLRSLAARLGFTIPSLNSNPESWFAGERMILDSGRVVPLMHVPCVWGYSSNVRYSSEGDRRFAFESIWLPQ